MLSCHFSVTHFHLDNEAYAGLLWTDSQFASPTAASETAAPTKWKKMKSSLVCSGLMLSKVCLMGIVCVPVEVVLCRMLAHNQSALQCVQTIWNHRGLSGFYSGFGWWLLSELQDATMWLATDILLPHGSGDENK